MSARRTSAEEVIGGIVRALPLRAAGFIVSVYGDAIGPRGGAVWVGTLIEICAAVGISESLVRTAVSRLVSAGRLEGWRRGRRSFYRLTQATRAEFDAAARVIYGPPEPWRWRFIHLPEAEGEARMAALERAGYARLRPLLAVGPARGAAPEDALCFEAEAGGDLGLLPGFAARAWDLETHAEAYRAFHSVFARLDAQTPALRGGEALAARLLLVHAWRQVVLRDPRLPREALPLDWPGAAARALFARVYCRLSPEAESYLAGRLGEAGGDLVAGSGLDSEAERAIRARLDLLRAVANGEDDQRVAGETQHSSNTSQIAE